MEAQPMLFFDDLRDMGIYLIRNKANGKKYVGSAVRINHRVSAHKTRLTRGDHPNARLQRAWSKYGADAFEVTVLEYVTNREDLLRREQHWLDTLQPFGGCGYNIACSARSPNLGRPMSAAARRKLSERSKGNQYNLGRKHPPRRKSWRERHGITIQGSKNANAKLTEAQAVEIKGLLAAYGNTPRSRKPDLSLSDIARRYNISATTVHDIRSGRLWGWLDASVSITGSTASE